MKEDKTNCVFCNILEGKLESSIVYEDEFAVALKVFNKTSASKVLNFGSADSKPWHSLQQTHLLTLK